MTHKDTIYIPARFKHVIRRIQIIIRLKVPFFMPFVIFHKAKVQNIRFTLQLPVVL